MSNWGQAGYGQQGYGQQGSQSNQQTSTQGGYSYGGQTGTAQGGYAYENQGAQQGYAYTQQQQQQQQPQVQYGQGSYGGYSAQQLSPGKQSAAAQAVSSLPPDQQAKLKNIISQVGAQTAAQQGGTGGYSNTQDTGGYQYGAQAATSQPPTSQPAYGQFAGQTAAAPTPAYGQAAGGYGTAPGYGSHQATAPAPAYNTQQTSAGFATGYTAGYGGNTGGATGGRYGGQPEPYQTQKPAQPQGGYGSQAARTSGGYGQARDGGGGGGGFGRGSRDRDGGNRQSGGGRFGGGGRGGGRGGRGGRDGGSAAPAMGQSASFWREAVESGGRFSDKDRGKRSERSESRHRDEKSEHGRDRDRDREPRHRDHDRDDKDRADRSRRDDKDRDRPPHSKSKEPETGARAERAASPRRAAPEYAVKVNNHSYATYERDYNQTVHRYSRLYVPGDFAKTISHWTQESGKRGTLGCSLLPLDKPATFEHIASFEATPDIPSPTLKPGATRFNAKVAMLCGLDAATKKDLLTGANAGDAHLHKSLKFMTVRTEKQGKRGGICLLGGAVDPSVDGDPTRGKKALVGACIRHVKSQLDLDLSGIKNWTRFLDVHYQRPAATSSPDDTETEEVTVVFLVDASEILPSQKDWPQVWEEQEAWKVKLAEHEAEKSAEPETAKDASKEADKKEGDTEMTEAKEEAVGEKPSALPETPTLLAKGQITEGGNKLRSACISLLGLLDYDEEDRDEGTLEMNLFAENFSELLARDYGSLILQALYSERTAALRRREERKRKRDEDRKADEEKELAKKAKAEPQEDKTEAKDDVPESQAEKGDVKAEADTKAEDVEMKEAEAVKEGDVKAEDGKNPEEADPISPQANEEAKDTSPSPAGDSVEPQEAKKGGRAKAGRGGRGKSRGRGGRGRGRGKKAAADSVEGEESDADASPEGKISQVDGAADVKPEESSKAEDTKAAAGKAEDTTKDREKPKKVVDEDLMLAFRYFDKTGTGYLKIDDVKRILHNLGLALSHRLVKDLCSEAADRDHKRQDRITYRDLYEKDAK